MRGRHASTCADRGASGRGAEDLRRPDNPRTGKRLYPGLYGGEMGWPRTAKHVINQDEGTSGVSSYDFWGARLLSQGRLAVPGVRLRQGRPARRRGSRPHHQRHESDLEAFRKLGHKLIYYHVAAADPLIPAQTASTISRASSAWRRAWRRRRVSIGRFWCPACITAPAARADRVRDVTAGAGDAAGRRSRRSARARALGWRARRAGQDHRHEIRGQRSGERRGVPASAVPVSPGRQLHRLGRRQDAANFTCATVK